VRLCALVRLKVLDNEVFDVSFLFSRARHSGAGRNVHGHDVFRFVLHGGDLRSLLTLHLRSSKEGRPAWTIILQCNIDFATVLFPSVSPRPNPHAPRHPSAPVPDPVPISLAFRFRFFSFPRSRLSPLSLRADRPLLHAAETF